MYHIHVQYFDDAPNYKQFVRKQNNTYIDVTIQQ